MYGTSVDQQYPRRLRFQVSQPRVRGLQRTILPQHLFGGLRVFGTAGAVDKAGARLYAPLRSHAAEVAGGPEVVDRQLVLAVE